MQWEIEESIPAATIRAFSFPNANPSRGSIDRVSAIVRSTIYYSDPTGRNVFGRAPIAIAPVCWVVVRVVSDDGTRGGIGVYWVPRHGDNEIETIICSPRWELQIRITVVGSKKTKSETWLGRKASYKEAILWQNCFRLKGAALSNLSHPVIFFLPQQHRRSYNISRT
jgi:hypothetical protein